MTDENLAANGGINGCTRAVKSFFGGEAIRRLEGSQTEISHAL